MDDKEDCNYFPLQVKATAVFFAHFTVAFSKLVHSRILEFWELKSKKSGRLGKAAVQLDHKQKLHFQWYFLPY